MDKNVKRVRLGCYSANVTMSIVGNLSAILFLIFHKTYGVSFSLLGTLALINFGVQLLVDLLFSFFSHRFHIQKAVRLSPVLGCLGLLVYALAPFVFTSSPYVGIAVGTVIFSAASGLNEVLISPIVAALPSDNPERDMSKTHSVYAWGVVGVVLFSTVFLKLFGEKFWFVLPLIFSVVPLVSAVAFFTSDVPALETPKRVKGALSLLKNKTVWLMIAAIFLGGACEITMTQWCSGYIEQSLGIPKLWGDVFGMATFAITLGLGRSLYAKYGKNMEKALFFSGVGSAVCYLVCILSPSPILGLIACAATGFCVAMMWPGSLVVASGKITTGGVFIFAMMAAGGDFGAAVGPQLAGIFTDAVSANPQAISFAQSLGLTGEQLAMKAGMCVGLFFSLLSIIVFLRIWQTAKKTRSENE